MKSLRLLQIGDIHYPDKRNERLGDLKDESFPSGIADAAQLSPLQCVVRAVTEVQEQRPKALLFCGDLTSRGNVAAYQECLSYLSKALRLNAYRPDNIHAVPGNHDVDRKSIDPSGVDLLKKFGEFRKAWEDIGLPILTVDAFRESVVRLGQKKAARIFSVNSSLGCGEKRYLPTKVRDELATLLAGYCSSVGLDAAFETVGETLDTPNFVAADITNICSQIQLMHETEQPVVVSHHNILPQALLRIDVYTEAVNAGFVRSRLSQLSRPVLYCHGHIHENPIEVVHKLPASESSALICISAPEFSRGFNVLDIEYGVNNIPLGCRLSRHTLELSDGSMKSVTHRIPFYRPDQLNLRRLGHPLLPQILGL